MSTGNVKLDSTDPDTVLSLGNDLEAERAAHLATRRDLSQAMADAQHNATERLREVEALRAEKALWEATLRETVATQKRERDAALESLRERCAAAVYRSPKSEWARDAVLAVPLEDASE